MNVLLPSSILKKKITERSENDFFPRIFHEISPPIFMLNAIPQNV